MIREVAEVGVQQSAMLQVQHCEVDEGLQCVPERRLALELAVAEVQPREVLGLCKS